MTLRIRPSPGFSLVEITLALGVASFCLIALFGLLSVGIQTNQSATSQTASTNILSAVFADMGATPKTTTTSAQFGITFGTAKTLYFDSEGTSTTAPTLTSRYQLNVTFPTSPSGSLSPTFAYLRVTWPAQANPVNATGMTEIFTAFDRHP